MNIDLPEPPKIIWKTNIIDASPNVIPTAFGRINTVFDMLQWTRGYEDVNRRDQHSALRVSGAQAVTLPADRRGRSAMSNNLKI